MYNFFVDENSVRGNKILISGSDVNHIKNVLRMKAGEEFFVNTQSKNYLCALESFECDRVVCSILDENALDSSLPIDLYLFQGLPKGDKMELIIQKATELGVKGIVPTEMNRCIVKLDDKKKKNKKERWQAIAESGAKQCKLCYIPEIFDVMSFDKALEFAKGLDLILLPYESKNGMLDTKDALCKIKKGMKVGIFIGSEGGFEPYEVEKAEKIGAKTVSLGKRILRTETAAITALSMCMLYAEITLNGEE